MDFSSYNTAVIAHAADILGWTKSVNIKSDGTLEWYGESSHPTDAEMNSKMVEAQAEYDANGAKDS
jgi:hypothetical protein